MYSAIGSAALSMSAGIGENVALPGITLGVKALPRYIVWAKCVPDLFSSRLPEFCLEALIEPTFDSLLACLLCAWELPRTFALCLPSLSVLDF